MRLNFSSPRFPSPSSCHYLTCSAHSKPLSIPKQRNRNWARVSAEHKESLSADCLTNKAIPIKRFVPHCPTNPVFLKNKKSSDSLPTFFFHGFWSFNSCKCILKHIHSPFEVTKSRHNLALTMEKLWSRLTYLELFTSYYLFFFMREGDEKHNILWEWPNWTKKLSDSKNNIIRLVLCVLTLEQVLGQVHPLHDPLRESPLHSRYCCLLPALTQGDHLSHKASNFKGQGK